MKTNAPLFSINWHDFAKGLLVAVLTAALGSLYPIIDTGALPTLAQLKVIGISSLTAAIAYILKNFLTNSSDQFLKKENQPSSINNHPSI